MLQCACAPKHAAYMILHVQRRGKKYLVLDPKISGFLGLLTEVSLLKEHGVDQ